MFVMSHRSSFYSDVKHFVFFNYCENELAHILTGLHSISGDLMRCTNGTDFIMIAISLRKVH